MDVYVGVFERLVGDAVFAAVGADVAYGGAGALLHDVAELAGELDLALAVHGRDFDGERGAAHRSPGKPRCGAHLVAVFGLVASVARGTEQGVQPLRRYLAPGLFALRHLYRRLAAHRVDVALQRADSRLARVALDERAQCAVGEGNVALFKPVGVKALGHEIALGYLQLFLFCIAADLDEFHPVEQRRGNGIHAVRRGYEEHLGKVVRYFEVPVAEGVVLGGVEHLQKSAGRIAAHIGGELVYLVQQKHGIYSAGVLYAVDYSPGHGADVGAPVSPYLRLVLYAAQAHPYELPAEGARHRRGYGSLAHAGRAHKAQYWRVEAAREFEHGQVFGYPLLYLFQSVVVLVEDLDRVFKIGGVLGLLGPRKV